VSAETLITFSVPKKAAGAIISGSDQLSPSSEERIILMLQAAWSLPLAPW
jgi:hypothetical protein